MLDAALVAFDEASCPGVPTWILEGERFWGKDRVEWLVEQIKQRLAASSLAGEHS